MSNTACGNCRYWDPEFIRGWHRKGKRAVESDHVLLTLFHIKFNRHAKTMEDLEHDGFAKIVDMATGSGLCRHTIPHGQGKFEDWATTEACHWCRGFQEDGPETAPGRQPAGIGLRETVLLANTEAMKSIAEKTGQHIYHLNSLAKPTRWLMRWLMR